MPESSWCGTCHKCGRFVGGASGSNKAYDGNGEHLCGPGYNTADKPTLVVGYDRDCSITREEILKRAVVDRLVAELTSRSRDLIKAKIAKGI